MAKINGPLRKVQGLLNNLYVKKEALKREEKKHGGKDVDPFLGAQRRLKRIISVEMAL